MIVKVNILNTVINVSVGDGKQSFKWLASVIQSRVKQFKVLRSNFGDENYIVTEIRNVHDELVNPADLIYEHVGPTGLEISAITSTSFPVDEWENPQQGDWLKGAHIHSKIGNDWYSEIEAWRESLTNIKQNSIGGGSYEENNTKILTYRNHQSNDSSLIKIGFNFSEADIAAAFDMDWVSMKWPWLDFIYAAAGDMATETQRLNQVGDALKRNFPLICNVFAHYCGVGQVGQRYGLTLNDFAHLLHGLRLHHAQSDIELIEEIFNKSGATAPTGNNNGKNGWPLMTRAHLSQALVYIAITECPLEEKPTQAVHHLLSGVLGEFWEEVTAKYMVYSSEHHVELQKTTVEYYQLLKQAFEFRATISNKFGPKMSVSDFVDMLLESTMTEPEHESVCVKSFIQAQINTDGDAAWELNYLVLSEFIEALSRVSVKIIENTSGLSDTKKIRMAFNFMTELPQHRHK